MPRPPLVRSLMGATLHDRARADHRPQAPTAGTFVPGWSGYAGPYRDRTEPSSSARSPARPTVPGMTLSPADRRRHLPFPRRHPGVRSGDQLTLGERAADRLRNGMGSWIFVFAALVFLAGWMIGNGGTGFDPYPFILLNLILSCLAAMQGAILLIAARRADQISSELAAHDYATDTDSEELINEVRALVRCIHRQVGAQDPADDDFGPGTLRTRLYRSDSPGARPPGN